MKYSKEVKTGILVILTLIVFYVFFNFLNGKNFFIDGRVFYVKYESVDGLEKAKPITVNGLKIGRVDEIKIIDSEQPIYFVVKLTISRDMKFSKKSIAEIYESSFISGKEIRLILDYNGEIAEPGDTLAGKVAPTLTNILSKQIGPTKDRIDSLLVSVKETSDNLQKLTDDENSKNLKQVLRNLNHTLSSFQQTANSISKASDNANRLITSNEGKFVTTLENTNSVLDETKSTMEKYGKVADKFNQLEVEKTLENFESASNKLNDLMTKAQSKEGTLGALLNDKQMYNNLNDTSLALKELMNDFKENPKKYLHFSVFGKKNKNQN